MPRCRPFSPPGREARSGAIGVLTSTSTPEASIASKRRSASKKTSVAVNVIAPNSSVRAVWPSTGSMRGKHSGASAG